MALRPLHPVAIYILPYVSTIDGAEVRFTCQKSALNLNQEENIRVTVYNKQGIWDPDPSEFCAIALGKFPKLMKHIMLLNEIIIT